MKKLGIAAAILIMVCVGASSVAAMSHGDAKVRIFWTGSGLLGPSPFSTYCPPIPKTRTGNHDARRHVYHRPPEGPGGV